MTRNEWIRLCRSAVPAASVFLFAGAWLVSGAGAQTALSSLPGSAAHDTAGATFQLAPTLGLGYAPSGAAVGDLTASGRLDLVTADYDSGKITVFAGVGQGSGGTGVDYAVGAHPNAVLVADINGDGRPDVVVSNESEGTISVLLGNGDGTLQTPHSYPVGFSPSMIAADDMNGDGKVDVAVAGKSNQLAVLLNDGSGNLRKPTLYSLVKTPTAIAVGQFTSDGHKDLALANNDGTVTVFLGKGAGAFRPLADIKVASGALSSILATGLNRNGSTDLVLTRSGENLVTVLSAKGDGTFSEPVSYPVGKEPVSAVAADLNGDGIADLVVLNKGSNTFSVLTGKSDGTFASAANFVAGNGPTAAFAGDFRGDGRVSLAIVNQAGMAVSVPAGNGDGTFRTGRSYAAGQRPVSIASGMLNSGKKPGLVVANYCGLDPSCAAAGSVSVFLADEKGIYQLSSSYAVGAGPVSVALADVDGDNSLDIIALNRRDRTLSILRGMGDGHFEQALAYPLAAAPVALAVGSLSKAGHTDIAVLEDCGSDTCTQPGGVEVLTGSAGGFRSVANYPVEYAPNSIVIGDINGDGHPDIVVSNRCGSSDSCESPGTASLLLGDGTGKFTAGADIELGNSPSSIALATIGNPKVPDLIVSLAADKTVAVLRGKGDGTFERAVPYGVGNGPGSLIVADFNGDGKADVAVANAKDGTVSVLFGRGDGTLNAAADFPVGSGPQALTAIGGKASGRASLATANGASGVSTRGKEMTVVENIQPEVVLTPTVTLMPAPTPNPSGFNQPVTLSVTVSGAGGTPTGTVVFQSNSNPIPTGGTPATDCSTGLNLNASGAATCTTSMLAVGSDGITVQYSGESGVYTAVTSSAKTQVVNELTPMLSVSGPTTASVNQPITFTATISLSSGSLQPTPPTGTVTFKVGGNAITCSSPATIDPTTYIASCTTPALIPATAQSVTASYPGDGNYKPASGTGSPITITPAVATIVITPSPSISVALGTSVTFTAQLTGPPLAPTLPRGVITFTINGSPSSDCPAMTVTSTGAATCTTSKLHAPTDVILAYYSVDANFTVPSPGTLTENVGKTLSQTALTSAPASPAVNQPVTFTVTVTPLSAQSTLPTGNISITMGATTICSGMTINSSTGVATCSWVFDSAAPSPGATIVATYVGDADYQRSVSPNLMEIVTASGTSTSVVSAPNPSSVGAPATFTATVTPAYAGAAKPNGIVLFTDTSTSTSLCPSQSISGGATAVCNYAFTAAGTNDVVATFTPTDGNFSGSASPAMGDVQTVGPSPLTVNLNGSPSTVAVNQQVTFTASMSVTGVTQPVGTMSYIDGASHVVLCSVSVSGGVTPPCVTALQSAGAHTITASFASANGNFSNATSGPATETVNPAATTANVTGPSASFVNQGVTFTVTVTPAFIGAATPGGTVTFFTQGTKLCTAIPLAPASGGVSTANCPAALPSTASYSVTAVFAGDSNFLTSTSNPVIDKVSQTTTSVAIASSLPVSVATQPQPVIFTATVTPLYLGATTPSGTVQFTSSDGTVNSACTAVPLAPSGTGTASATCPTVFPGTTSGQVAIMAKYSGDGNFDTGAGNSSQTVQNFSVAFTAPAAGAVTLTEGYANPTDPFNPATVTVNSLPVSGFSDSLQVTCAVTAVVVANASKVTAPTCTPSPTTLAGDGGTALSYTLAAPNGVNIGSYSIVLTAQDTLNTALTHVSAPLTVYVVGTSAGLNLTPGVIGTETVDFNTAAAASGDSLTGFKCGSIVEVVGGVLQAPKASTNLNCKGPSAAVSVTGGSTAVPISISTTTNTAQLQRSGTIYAATLLGMPLLTLLGWMGSVRSARRNLFRISGLILLLVIAGYATACGGSFTPPATPPTSAFPTGSYYVQVVATDSAGATYYAVVPLTVNAN